MLLLKLTPLVSRVDIVFIADPDYTGGPNDPQFLNAVSTIIRDAYYAFDPRFRPAGLMFLQQQDMINFWIALDMGDANFVGGRCELNPPSDWNRAYTFADIGAIVHTAVFRDCAKRDRRLFSSEPVEPQTFLHETGHVPFGLADEYCCDPSYFESVPFPNVYRTQAACLRDNLAVGVADACQPIARPNAYPQHPQAPPQSVNWFRLDPLSTFGNDLMVGCGNYTPQPADRRQINWFFDTCRMSGEEC
jgi:hypothetical protein